VSTRYRITYHRDNEGGEPIPCQDEFDDLFFARFSLERIKQKASFGYPVVFEKVTIEQLEYSDGLEEMTP
jgi:hypothetical protein